MSLFSVIYNLNLYMLLLNFQRLYKQGCHKTCNPWKTRNLTIEAKKHVFWQVFKIKPGISKKNSMLSSKTLIWHKKIIIQIKILCHDQRFSSKNAFMQLTVSF